MTAPFSDSFDRQLYSYRSARSGSTFMARRDWM
jgi:hypothetical protein